MRWETLQDLKVGNGLEALEYSILASPMEPEYLSYVECYEYSSGSRDPAHDVVSISIRNGKDEFVLRAGWLYDGWMFWSGQIPVSSPQFIRSRFTRVQDGNTYRMRVMLLKRGEL